MNSSLSTVLRFAWRPALLGALLLALAAGQAHAALCFPSAARLCLWQQRFAVEVAWTVPGLGVGAGQAVPHSEDTGLFWFFQNSNLELVVKVLDGRIVNGHFWIYYGGLSDVEYKVTVTDTETGAQEIYHNPAGKLASRADTSTFDAAPLAAGHTVRFGALGEATAAAAPAAVPVPLRQGPEFPVNVTTLGRQWDPAVAIGADEGSMVVWAGDPGIFGRLYDRAGVPRTGEFRLDSAKGEFAHSPGVAASATGEYMATWYEGGPAGHRVAARLFAPDGQPLGVEIRIGADSRRPGPPVVVADPAGGFLVAWPDAGDASAGAPSSLRWQRFDAQGQRVGREIAIHRLGWDLRVAASPAGGFVLAWFEEAGSFQRDVLALRLDAAGEPIVNTLARVNSTDFQRLPGYHVAAVPVVHSDQGFSIVWSTLVFHGQTGTAGIFARRYDANGAPAGAIVQLWKGEPRNQAEAVAALPSGDLLVIREEIGPADPDGGLLGQLFDDSWRPLGTPTRINTYTQDQQTDPAVAVDSSGNLVAVWSSGVGELLILPPEGWGSGTQDGHFYGVFGQRFTTASCALGPSQLCLGGRFRAEVEFADPWTGKPEAGRAVPLTSDTGAFWFFYESNVELIVKILDGRTVNGQFWLYAGALSDVAYTLIVTDTETGRRRTYRNSHGRLASWADIEAFPAGDR